MINKQSIWLLTLFSLILVLSVYYITMPSEFLATASNTAKEENKEVVKVKESEVISTLKVENNEEREEKITELQTILTSESSTSEEKNNAYEELKTLNILKGKEEEISAKITNQYKLENFVKIKDDQVRIVVIKDKHDTKLANEIMNLVQESFDTKMYISVKFQK
ncbi:MAG: SpoIIIAH-like family protein [Bacilli bacterium]|nr:SpoIIIAH-like family protein [Bacilli bacterium]